MKFLRRSLLGLSLFAGCLLTSCCWWDSNFFDYWPVNDASEEAQRYAAENGYRMEGYLGKFIREPDGLGGCEVQIEFHDLSGYQPERKVNIRLRRAWRLSGWKVVGMTIDKVR